MEPKAKKIIQKRVARRERFARMARIRHRKGKDVVIAKCQDLDLPPKYEPQSNLYENAFGLLISESEEGLDNEISLLNDMYISNGVTVHEDNNKLICIKLHKNDRKGCELKDQVLDEWEKRDDPYWAEWAKHMRRMRGSFKEFLDKSKDKFEANKLDEETLKKQKAFAAKRDELMSKKACFELKIRFNDKGSAASELVFNSGFVKNLNYDFEEFIQRILVEGIPRLRPSNGKNFKRPTLIKSFEDVFNNTAELTFPDTLFFTKSSHLKKLDHTVLAGGYFVKNAAEMSILLSVNDSDALLEGEVINRPIYRLYMEQQMAHETEKKYFLETYYKDIIAQMIIVENEAGQLKLCEDEMKEEIQEETDRESNRSGKISEDLVVKDTVDFNNKSVNKEPVVSVPYTDYFTQLMPQLKLMKNVYQSQQKMLDSLLQQNISKILSKQK